MFGHPEKEINNLSAEETNKSIKKLKMEVELSEYTVFLITLINRGEYKYLLRFSLKVHNDKIKSDTREYYNEPESRKEISDLLPLHVKNDFDIVDIETIFDATIVK